MAEAVELVKGGEQCISVSLDKSLSGFKIQVKALPKVEDFFRDLCNNNIREAQVIGRLWAPYGKDPPPLQVYSPVDDTVFPRTISNGRIIYAMNRVGQSILEGDDGEDNGANPPRLMKAGPALGVVNISFLRLVGISEGNGVTFQVRGVYSNGAVRRMHDKIQEALRAFYLDYMKPIRVSILVSTQSI